MEILKMEDLGLEDLGLIDSTCFKSKYTLENGEVVITKTRIKNIPPINVNDIRIANEIKCLLKHNVSYNECRDFFKRQWI